MNVYVMPVEGGEERPLTFGAGERVLPAWSPDGREIAFVLRQESKGSVWRVPVVGGPPIPVPGYAIGQGTSQLEWAPGSQIIVHSPGNRNFVFLDPVSGQAAPLFVFSLKDAGLLYVPQVVRRGVSGGIHAVLCDTGDLVLDTRRTNGARPCCSPVVSRLARFARNVRIS